MGDVHAIDVSRWQNVINWAEVKASGVQGSWNKVGGADGGLYKDSQADNNLNGCEAVGLPYGTYYFVEPQIGQGFNQARHAIDCGHGRGHLWPVIDIEVNPHGLSNSQLDDFTNDFCNEVKRLTGRESIVYTGAYTGVGHTHDNNPNCPLWVANYGSNTPGTQPPSFTPAVPPAWAAEGWSAWQFNSTTYIPGISGNTVDQNTVREDFWAQMMGAEQEIVMPTRSVVRSKNGSQFAAEILGPHPGEHFWSLIEGAGTVRYLPNVDVVNQECFWLGISPADTWLVDDVFFEGRYYYETEKGVNSASASTASTNAVLTTLAAVLLLALVVGIELGRAAGWYDINHWQVAGIVGVIAIVAALVGVFVEFFPFSLKRKRHHRDET